MKIDLLELSKKRIIKMEKAINTHQYSQKELKFKNKALKKEKEWKKHLENKG